MIPMEKQLSIGAVARSTGLSVKAIRFYEDGGFIPRAARTDAGYRHFSGEDVRRLRLLRQMRVLGMPLSEIKPVVARALSADCATFSSELVEIFAQQRGEIDKRIAELEALRTSLDDLSRHIEHCECEPGQAVLDCDYCPILDEEGGDLIGPGTSGP
jgi:MerR family transcriptional regulator, copper efflux regulator